jgi:hypothetical protein
MVNILAGQKGTANSSPTSTTNGWVGNCLVTNGASPSVTFSGMTASSTSNGSCAIIVYVTTSAGLQSAFATSTVNSGWFFGGNNSSKLSIYNGSVSTASTISISANTPYFLAYSALNGTATNFLALNLSNGVLQTQVAASPGAATAGNGTYIVGNDTFNDVCTADIHAVAYFDSYIPMSTLIQWATDPWAFWYPRVGPSIDVWHGTFAAASAVRFRKTLSQIGGRVGTRQPQGWAN